MCKIFEIMPYCIICGESISLNKNNPYCQKCIQSCTSFDLGASSVMPLIFVISAALNPIYQIKIQYVLPVRKVKKINIHLNLHLNNKQQY